jgi:hypothetical protein
LPANVSANPSGVLFYFYPLRVDLYGYFTLDKIRFVRAGVMGATIIGTAFIFPAFLMVLAIGKDYVFSA